MFELRPYRNNNHMTTYDPFRDMEALERAFFGNRDFLGDVGTFKTDIQDKGDHYLLEADLPGMKKEDIAIDIDGDNLTRTRRAITSAASAATAATRGASISPASRPRASRPATTTAC